MFICTLKKNYFQDGVKKEVKTSESPVMKAAEKKSAPHMEFGGPVGTLLMTLFLPATVYYINMACSKVQ